MCSGCKADHGEDLGRCMDCVDSEGLLLGILHLRAMRLVTRQTQEPSEGTRTMEKLAGTRNDMKIKGDGGLGGGSNVPTWE